MSQDKNPPGSAADWLARAKGDLVLAEMPLPAGAFYEDLCFHTQQAAEKALKAVYRHRELTFQYTHDLDAGGTELPRSIARGLSSSLLPTSLLVTRCCARFPLERPLLDAKR